MTRTTQARTRTAARQGVIAAAVVFLTLAGAGTATALWSTQVPVGSFTADAATVGVSHSIDDDLDHTYTSGSLAAAEAVVVTNTGSREAAFSVAVSATSVSDVRASVTVRLAVVVDAAACTPSATLTAPVTGSLASATVLSSAPAALAAGASVTVCVQTILASVATHGGKSLTGSIVSSSTASVQSGWSDSTSPFSFAQNVQAGGTPITFAGTGKYWIRNALSASHCISTQDWGTNNNTSLWQNSGCRNESVTWWDEADKLWTFHATSDGYYRIENVNGSRNMGVSSSTSGSAVLMQNGTDAARQWAFIDNGDGTVVLRSRANPSLCVAVNNSNPLASETSGFLHIVACDANAATQRWVIDLYEVVVPPPITLQCTGSDGYNVNYSWPRLAGYEGETIYRVLLNGVVVPSNAYGGATGWDTVLRFGHSNNNLQAFGNQYGFGVKALTLEQSVLGGPWTTTGTASFALSATHPKVLCGP